MSTFNKLLGMASKALGSQQSTGAAQNGANGTPNSANPSQTSGGTDWRSVVRAAADRLTGDERPQHGAAQPSAPRPSVAHRTTPSAAAGGAPLSQSDRDALARYDYLLRTAPPERLEQVHQEAFARLTPEQRAVVLERLSGALPAGERPRSADSAELARAATRGEVSKPGLMKRVLGSGAGRGAGAGAGALAGVGLAAAGGLAVAIAGGAIASAAAGPILAEAANLGIDFMGLADVGDGLTASVEGLTGDLGATASEAVSGGTDALGGLGEQASDFASGFSLPGLGDLFGDR